MLHRDINPNNFLIGKGNQENTLFVVDFGLSKRYRHPKTMKHIPYRKGKRLHGPPRYASCNIHLGIEQSRRDDLESIAYILIYFARGKLPWQNLRAKTKYTKYSKIRDMKLTVNIKKMCKDIPEELMNFLEYSRSLSFNEQPNYQYFRNIFSEAARSGKYGDPNLDFDWVEIEKAKE